MSKIKYRFLIITLCLSTLLLFTACSKQLSSPDTLRWTVGSEPESLDPRKFQSLPPAKIADQLFEGLFTLNNNGELIPAAAEKWDVSPDGLVYTFKLRSNAKWSNGEPVTAQDFEYAWKSTLDPEFASPYANIMYFLKNGEAYNNKQVTIDDVGVQALDDFTLKVTLEKPTPFFLTLTSFHTYFPVNKKVATSNTKWAVNADTFISNGPFKMTAWEHTKKITLSPNTFYWDKESVKLPSIECILVDNNTTALAMFENKQVDISEITPPTSEMPRLFAANFLKSLPMLNTSYYEINNKHKPLNDVRIRQALSLSLERTKLIAEDKKSDIATEAFAWVPYGIPDIKHDSDFRKTGGNYINENIERAKQLLAEAGYPNGQNFPKLTILFINNTVSRTIAEATQAMWKKNLNIDVQLQNQEPKVFYSSLNQGNFDLAYTNWVGDYTDPLTFMDVYLTNTSNNTAFYSNPQYDALITQISLLTDNNKRLEMFHNAEKILMQDMPMIPCFFGKSIYLDHNNFTGITRNATGKCLFKNAYKKH